MGLILFVSMVMVDVASLILPTPQAKPAVVVVDDEIIPALTFEVEENIIIVKTGE